MIFLLLILFSLTFSVSARDYITDSWGDQWHISYFESRGIPRSEWESYINSIQPTFGGTDDPDYPEHSYPEPAPSEPADDPDPPPENLIPSDDPPLLPPNDYEVIDWWNTLDPTYPEDFYPPEHPTPPPNVPNIANTSELAVLQEIRDILNLFYALIVLGISFYIVRFIIRTGTLNLSRYSGF